MERIEVLDTTLRDGAQGENVVFSREDKLKVIRALDQLGVQYIEAGNPASNPKDRELFEFLSRHMTLAHARLVAFGATCHVGSDAARDEGLHVLAHSGADTISLFGKCSRAQAEQVLRCTPEENLRIIRQSIEYLRAEGLGILFDAEHFFDGFEEDADYALETLAVAKRAGAERLVLCDTNGGMLPEQVTRATRRVVAELGMPVGIHCHDDSGLATACTLAAVEAGATQVQGTINGYGERCGNANLCQVIPNLHFKLHKACLGEAQLKQLTPTARFIAEVLNLPMNERSPYVGRSAFAHKGGMHIDGMLKYQGAFEHVAPECVGNQRRYLVSEMAGRGALLTKLTTIAPELTKDSRQTLEIMDMLKRLEREGYSFEGADGSLKLRVMGALGRRPHYFEVIDFHVISGKRIGDASAQAYMKVSVDGQIEMTADEGDGPINALDKALRKALTRFYPCLNDMRLKDFKVRVVDGAGTASTTRVSIESTDGATDWSTVGVSSNVIEASFIALTDSIEHMLLEAAGRSD